MNLTRHFFFFAVSAGIVHFQLPNLVYLRVVCVCTFLLYINRITICIMANGSFQQFREYQSQSYTCNQKTPLTNYLTDEIVQLFYYIFFLFKREGGSCHSLGTCSYTYDNYYIQCFTSLMFNNNNLVTLKGQLLKVQFSELQYSC